MSVRKIIYCIRHGLSEHNVAFRTMGVEAYHVLEDTGLEKEGEEQADFLNKYWAEKNNVDVVFTSPLTRTIQTTLKIFKNSDKPIYAMDILKEYPFNYEKINKRKNKRDLVTNYRDNINFKYLKSEEDPNWVENDVYENKETVNNLKKRCQEMKKFILERPEERIAIVSHSSYLQCFLTQELEDENVELKHCYPYELTYQNNHFIY